MNSPTHKQIRIAVMASNDVEDIELLIPIDVWRRAGCVVDVVVLETKNNFTLKYSDLKVTSRYNLKHTNLIQYDAIYMPGGQVNKSYLTPPISMKVPGEPKLHSAIRKFFDDPTKFLIALCSAPIALLTILGHDRADQIKFTAHPTHVNHEEYKKNSMDKDIVVSKQVITGRDAGCSFDLAFETLKQMVSHEEAVRISKILGIDWKPYQE